MPDRDRRDPVPVAVEHDARLELDDLELEADPACGAQRQSEQLAQAAWPVDRQRPFAPAQIEGLQQPRQPEPVIGVEMGQEDLGQIHQADRADKLALGALAAVDQDPVAAATNQHRRQPASCRRNRPGGTGEEHGEVHARQSVSRARRARTLTAPLADPCDSHRVLRRASALRRAAGIEDLKAVLVVLVQRDVGVPEHDCIRLREASSHPCEPSRGRAGVVQHGDRDAARSHERGLGQRIPHLGPVHVSVHADHVCRSERLQLPQHRQRHEVPGVDDQVGAPAAV